MSWRGTEGHRKRGGKHKAREDGFGGILDVTKMLYGCWDGALENCLLVCSRREASYGNLPRLVFPEHDFCQIKNHVAM